MAKMAIRAAIAAAAGLSSAARRVASRLRHSAPPRCARRHGFVVGDTNATPTAACTRPQLPHDAALSSGPHVLRRRGLIVILGEGSPEISDPSDPESPDDPETCFAYDEKDLESRWSVFHGVKRDREDMLRRFSLFKDRARDILELNKSGKPWTQGLNRFGDWTPEELSRFYPPKLSRPLAERCSVCLERKSPSN